jgi:hypothetical protein
MIYANIMETRIMVKKLEKILNRKMIDTFVRTITTKFLIFRRIFWSFEGLMCIISHGFQIDETLKL